MNTEAHIILDKELRRDIDAIIQRLKTGNKPLPEPVEIAWGIIANAGGGDWLKESEEWQEAAAKWRDENLGREPVGPASMRQSRERSLAITKLQEAVMWLGMDLKAINEESPGAIANPYPNSKDPSNTKIEPTADGLKL